jgi:D-3-phosphoglycerate dehydrogenase
MAKIKAAVTAPIVKKYLEEMEKYCDIKIGGYAVTGVYMPEDELISFIEGREVLIVEFEGVTRKVIENSQSLALIICVRGNPVNVDTLAAAEKGIPVVFTPGRNANSVAEYIVSSMISVCRHLGRANHEIKNGRYLDETADDIYAPSANDDVLWLMNAEDSPYREYKGIEITGRTMGFIGLGAVGLRTVELLAGMNMRFLAYDPYCAPELAAKYRVELLPMNEVFAHSEFITVCCKTTPETTGMIGREQFDLMQKHAYFINTARGTIVRQKDLVEALEQKKFAGAALDVFWREPLPKNHPLLNMPNVLLTPHIAGASYDVTACQSRMAAEDLANYALGRPLLRVFNRKGPAEGS